MVEGLDIPVDRPEDTVVVVSIGKGYNPDGGEFLYVPRPPRWGGKPSAHLV